MKMNNPRLDVNKLMTIAYSFCEMIEGLIKHPKYPKKESLFHKAVDGVVDMLNASSIQAAEEACQVVSECIKQIYDYKNKAYLNEDQFNSIYESCCEMAAAMAKYYEQLHNGVHKDKFKHEFTEFCNRHNIVLNYLSERDSLEMKAVVINTYLVQATSIGFHPAYK